MKRMPPTKTTPTIVLDLIQRLDLIIQKDLEKERQRESDLRAANRVIAQLSEELKADREKLRRLQEILGMTK